MLTEKVFLLPQNYCKLDRKEKGEPGTEATAIVRNVSKCAEGNPL